MHTIRYLSLFSGIGGFEFGLQQAARVHTQKNGAKIKLHCAGFSEIDSVATAIYQRHFPEHPTLGDIESIEADTLPSIDLLVGGFPCQAFSLAGLRRGFTDQRGLLFFAIIRLLEAKRPPLVLLENVKGLLSHQNGRTFRSVLTALDDLGYDVEWQVLDSQNFGVPQRRERVYIVGHLGCARGREIFPIAGKAGSGCMVFRTGRGDQRI